MKIRAGRVPPQDFFGYSDHDDEAKHGCHLEVDFDSTLYGI